MENKKNKDDIFTSIGYVIRHLDDEKSCDGIAVNKDTECEEVDLKSLEDSGFYDYRTAVFNDIVEYTKTYHAIFPSKQALKDAILSDSRITGGKAMNYTSNEQALNYLVHAKFFTFDGIEKLTKIYKESPKVRFKRDEDEEEEIDEEAAAREEVLADIAYRRYHKIDAIIRSKIAHEVLNEAIDAGVDNYYINFLEVF